MPDCARCGSALGDPLRQPAERKPPTDAATEAEHYRCPDCGAGGYRVVDDRRVLRSGGPAFTGQTARDDAIAANGGDPLQAVTDGGLDGARHEKRQADALERIADAQERQARAAEVHAGAVAEQTHIMLPGTNSVEAALEEFQMWLDVYRKEVEHP